MFTSTQVSFKVCSLCKTSWESPQIFLADTDLEFIGYQPDFESKEDGLFFFTHFKKNCNTTIAVAVQSFFYLYDGAQFKDSRQYTEDCPKYCLDVSQLSRCSAPCKHAHVREISQIIRDRFVK